MALEICLNPDGTMSTDDGTTQSTFCPCPADGINVPLTGADEATNKAAGVAALAGQPVGTVVCDDGSNDCWRMFGIMTPSGAKVHAHMNAEAHTSVHNHVQSPFIRQNQAFSLSQPNGTIITPIHALSASVTNLSPCLDMALKKDWSGFQAAWANLRGQYWLSCDPFPISGFLFNEGSNNSGYKLVQSDRTGKLSTDKTAQGWNQCLTLAPGAVDSASVLLRVFIRIAPTDPDPAEPPVVFQMQHAITYIGSTIAP